MFYDITNTAFMTSDLLSMTSQPRFRASHHFIYDIKSTVSDITSTVSESSHPLYWWYHNCISEITSAKIYDIISIVYDMRATVWHHNHCIHDIRFPTYDITSRVYDISSPIPLKSQTLCQLCLTANTRCEGNKTRISEITTSICVSVWSHTIYWRYNTHSFMTWHLLYLWPSMHCIWHLTHDLWHHNTLSITSVYYISYQTVSDSTSTASLSSHPDYRSYNPHGMYDNTGTICMTSSEYMWHHIHSLWYHTALWHSHTLCSWQHTQDTFHHITVADLLLRVYWL